MAPPHHATSDSGDDATSSVLLGLLEALACIPELFLPGLALVLVCGLVAAPFYIAYRAHLAFTDTPVLAEPAITWIEELPAAPLEAPCPYCGTRDHEPVRTCPGCGVPHHAACWEENRGCTVYACTAQARPAGQLAGRA